jgi:class 3 adenylate cyclase
MNLPYARIGVKIGVNFYRHGQKFRQATTRRDRWRVAMQQIADWLEKLGMSEYTDRFVENRIDLSVLPDLTDQDLKDLGVLLGDRRKLLRAIRDLGGAQVAVAAPSAPVATEPARRDDAERRQLTLMFTDLVSSTALSIKLDPEDMRSVIGAYHKCVAETVGRFDGFVAKYMGDGVLVYFGYPQAHEDDAERAVRAGLGLVEAVGKLRVQEPLRVRIGIATGLVVVGDLVGSGEAQESGDNRHLFTAVWGSWLSRSATGPMAAARNLSDKLLGLTEKQEDIGLRLQAHHSGWTTYFVSGAPARSLEHCQLGVRLYDPEKHRPHALLYGGHDPGVCARTFLATVEWLLGFPDAALASINSAVV